MRHETGDANGTLDERPGDLVSHASRLTSSLALRFTLRAWPVVALATISLCFLTQQVAGWFGIMLPDQQNIEIVKRYAGWNRTFLFLCAQIIIILPAFEELIFRYLLFRFPLFWSSKRKRGSGFLAACQKAAPWAAVSSLLFSAAHYIAQPFPDAAFIALFFFGLAQCWLYRKTNRIWCPMLNHALFNLTNLILLFVIPQA